MDQSQQNRTALFGMMMAFFVIGFMSAFNDILMPNFRHIFHLDYMEMSLVSFSFFISYGVFSIPMSVLTANMGYRNGILIGFLLNIVGGVIIMTSVNSGHYYLFLAALFIMSSGVVLMLISAMPFSLLLGQEKTASSRVTFVEVFHSLGAMIAPLFGGYLLLSASHFMSSSLIPSAHITNVSLQICYVIILIVLLVLVTILASLPMRQIQSRPNILQRAAFIELIKNKAFLACVFALFLYVGSEITVGGFMINFTKSQHIDGLTATDAASLVSLYWALLLVGRFFGSFILRAIRPRTMILLCSIGSILMLILNFFLSGYPAIFALVFVGLFNSIVFPTLYSLGLNYAKGREIVASGILAMSVVGGAIIPLIQGGVADHFSLQYSFIVPLLCYVMIMLYSFISRKNS